MGFDEEDEEEDEEEEEEEEDEEDAVDAVEDADEDEESEDDEAAASFMATSSSATTGSSTIADMLAARREFSIVGGRDPKTMLLPQYIRPDFKVGVLGRLVEKNFLGFFT